MSMLIGAGNALQNFGDKIGGAMVASKERQRLEEQRAFQNLMAQRQLDMQTNSQAQEQARWEKERVLKLISSMPQGEGRVSQEVGQGLLDKAPDLGMFIQQAKTLPSRDLGMTPGGGIGDAGGYKAPQNDGFQINRPESDAYARAILTQQGKDKDRDLRASNAKARILQGENATAARRQIAQIADKTRRDIAFAQLDSIAKRHADSLAVQNDLSDLAYLRADAEVIDEYQKLMSSPLNLVPSGTTRGPLPSSKRRPPRGTAPAPTAARDPNDDLIDSIFGGSQVP
jgi:hypothetical protein